MSPRKRPSLPDITDFLKRIGSELKVRYFSLKEIPAAVLWAEQGNIAIHENYLSRKKQSYHVISGERDRLVLFCQKVGLSEQIISASEFYHFWHLTWFPSGGHFIDSTSVAIGAVRSSPRRRKSEDQARQRPLID